MLIGYSILSTVVGDVAPLAELSLELTMEVILLNCDGNVAKFSGTTLKEICTFGAPTSGLMRKLSIEFKSVIPAAVIKSFTEKDKPLAKLMLFTV